MSDTKDTTIDAAHCRSRWVNIKCDGETFRTTSDTLTKAAYFQAKIARWTSSDTDELTIELDTDANLFRKVLRVLRGEHLSISRDLNTRLTYFGVKLAGECTYSDDDSDDSDTSYDYHSDDEQYEIDDNPQSRVVDPRLPLVNARGERLWFSPIQVPPDPNMTLMKLANLLAELLLACAFRLVGACLCIMSGVALLGAATDCIDDIGPLYQVNARYKVLNTLFACTGAAVVGLAVYNFVLIYNYLLGRA